MLQPRYERRNEREWKKLLLSRDKQDNKRKEGERKREQKEQDASEGGWINQRVS